MRDPGRPDRARLSPGPELRGGVLAEVAEPPAIAPSEDPELAALIHDEPQVVTLERGAILFVEGDLANCMYVVKQGTLRIRSGSVLYEDVGPGGIVGEMGLVERHKPRSATVYALSECELVCLDEARFFSLVSEMPYFALTVMQVLSRRLRVMDQRYRPEPRS